MTNALVGDVYEKIIQEVVDASKNDFEESGVGQGTLNELQQEWQHKLSGRGVAQMPWDPKPVPPVVQQPPQQVQQHHQQQQQQQPVHNAGLPNPGNNGMPPVSYGGYQNNVSAPSNGTGRIKTEPGMEQQQQQQPQQQQQQQQYHGLPPMSSYSQINGGQGGGAVRAQQLVEQQFGPGATAGFQRGGLALPGQQNAKPQAHPQGLQLPPNNPQQMQNQYQQQQQQAMQQRQQQQLNQQQQNPQIKVENNNQNGAQNQYQQQPAANYSQTDGADDADDALEEWRAMLAERRAVAANQTERANRMMRERISALSDELQSGLMLPLDEQQGRLQARNRKAAALKANRATAQSNTTGTSSMPKIAQMDGDAGDDEEDEDAINSDLDDPEDETNQINDDDDDNGDTILCTYDKVQRVKNKWKCTLKDGVLNANGKEWLFHKGNGEFEW